MQTQVYCPGLSGFARFAGLWFLYLVAYGLFPLSLSADIYHLFQDVLATTPNFWLLCVLPPVLCVLPGFVLRQAWQCASFVQHLSCLTTCDGKAIVSGLQVSP